MDLSDTAINLIADIRLANILVFGVWAFCRRHSPSMNGENRLNPAGVYPRKLIYSLRDSRSVMDARRIDACLVCRNGRVNEAGLCPVCYGMLDGDELALAIRWMNGQGP